jgi:NAD(P)-dependent dehydrogenase (short-subunit alcohol dehydrogenase family)
VAEQVATEIRDAGGEAVANASSVTDFAAVEAMITDALDRWGRVDILVNNAGILRDSSFAKMTPADFRAVIDVHLIGSMHCARAVWPAMRDQGYGRIVMTTSAAGLFGSFGQTNYAAAKMGLIGLMNSLHLEGAKHGIRVNALAPAAMTRMTESIGDVPGAELMTTESVSAALVYLVSRDAPSKMILNAGGGSYSVARITETEGVHFAQGHQTPEAIADAIERIGDPSGEHLPQDAHSQIGRLVGLAKSAKSTA